MPKSRVGVKQRDLEEDVLDARELRAALARRDWPSWKLASRLGVSPSTFSAFVTGQRPSPPGFRRLCEAALQLTPGSLHRVPRQPGSPRHEAPPPARISSNRPGKGS